MAADRLILIGMMGSGKTTIGRLLADRTRWPYVDNDTLLSDRTGETARELSAGGEEAVRKAEAEMLRLELAAPQPAIVGVAAGTILDADNRELIDNAGVVVWLRARPETLAARTRGSAHRPWLGTDALAWFRSTVAERDDLYASIADITLDVDDASPAGAAAEILAQRAVRSLVKRH